MLHNQSLESSIQLDRSSAMATADFSHASCLFYNGIISSVLYVTREMFFSA